MYLIIRIARVPYKHTAISVKADKGNCQMHNFNAFNMTKIK
jgi:hypothetical protein